MRLIVRITAAACRAWLRSSVRRAWREAVRWNTARMLEDIDLEAAALRELRDKTIPLGFRALAEQKQELLEQWKRFSDDAPCPVPRPDPEPHPAAGGWSPNTPARVGPLFQQRNPKQ